MHSEVIARIEAANDEQRKQPPAQEPAERKLELKICERCGGLWLRPAGCRWIYCGPCKRQVDELPPVTLKPLRKRSRNAGVTSAHPRTERVQ